MSRTSDDVVRAGMADADAGGTDVVVAYDGTWRGDMALRRAVLEAARHGSRLLVLTIVAEPSGTLVGARERERVAGKAVRAAQALLVAARERSADVDPSVRIETVLASDLDDPSITHAARAARLLVLGRRGARGDGVFLSGTTSHELARRFSCPLLVCQDGLGPSRRPTAHPPQVIVGVNSAQDVDVVLPAARREADERGVVLTILRAQSVVSTEPDLVLENTWAWLRHHRESEATDADAPLGPGTTPRLIVTTGDPAQALVGHARTDDLIVVGTRSWGRLSGLITGAVERSVLDRMPCDVLIVRPADLALADPVPAAAASGIGSGRT